MQQHNETPGTPEWLARRATCFNASDAPAMLGCSPHETRAQLLARLHSGLRKDISDYQQERVLDPGHSFEAFARPQAEKVIGEDLFPIGGSQGFGLSRPFGASYDGITMAEDTVWEHKRLNEELRAALPKRGPDGNDSASLPKHHRVQMEQQLLVSGAARSLFTASDWNAAGDLLDIRHCWYESDAELRTAILAGWKQFDADLATHEPTAPAERVAAAPIEALPAISARIMGELTISSNLPAFGEALKAFVARIPGSPATEQEFADAEAACKALKKAEEALDGAESNALGQVQSVEVLTRTIGDLRNVARTARLATEKLVKARKEQIRIEECQRGKRALDGHLQSLNEQIGGSYMPAIVADFGAAISGVKTIDSLKARVDQLLADKKIEANEIAGRITVNLRTYRAHEDYAALFPDLRQIVTKTAEDFQALVQSRVLAHQAEEKRRAEAAAERERERIRAEEQAKAEKEAREKLQREQRERDAAERNQRGSAETLPIGIAGGGQVGDGEDAIRLRISSQGAPAASKVVPMAQPASRGAPSLRIGEIASRLGVGVTEQFLRQLGFAPAAKQGASCLFHEEAFDLICEALIAHVRTVQAKQHEAVAA